MDQETATDVANSLRSMADFIEANPDVSPYKGDRFREIEYRIPIQFAPVLRSDFNDEGEIELSSFDKQKTHLTKFVRLGLNHGAEIAKDYFDDRAWVTLKFGNSVSIKLVAERDAVCTKRIVDTVTEIERVPVEWEEKEVTREVVEWDCLPLLKV